MSNMNQIDVVFQKLLSGHQFLCNLKKKKAHNSVNN